ncbi:MAG: rhomboid family intramembrane serine protease [Muribaculaceae bacterium]|nr:rhomboid family intramembrane serine protease [Muribaculaceae bacterium]
MRRYLFGSSLNIVIALNVGFFLVLGLIYLCTGFQTATSFAMFAPISNWLIQPWGAVSYMFIQTNFFHLLFNMLWLWAFGTLLNRMATNRTFWGVYLCSGLTGALSFLIFCTVKNNEVALLIGSSSSVLGIISGVTALNPKMELNMFLFGNVRLFWVAFFAIIIIVGATGCDNLPVLMAHLGGIIGGVLYIVLFRKLTVHKPKAKNSFFYNVRLQEKRGLKDSEQAELDRLLVLVRNSGYKSLNDKQRRRLFALSEKIKKQ